MKSLPGAGFLFELIQLWWRKQPLHLVGTLLAEQGVARLRPLARRHPFALLCGAAVLGGLLVWAKPWRMLKPAWLAGLTQELLAKACSGASLEACLAAFAAMSSKPDTASAASTAPGAAD